MHCPIFVVVRTGSSRLPGKALLKIGGKPLIKILIDRVNSSKIPNLIVVCTTNKKSDDELSKFLRSLNIEVFRGSEKDVLRRLYQAGKKYKTKRFVVVEGDDIFCDPELIDKTCKKLESTSFDFIFWKNLPLGVSPIGIKTKSLQKLIEKKINKNTDTGWGQLIIESNLFKVGKLNPPSKKLARPQIRLTIDYKEDFELAKKLLEKLPEKFSLLNLINILDKNKEWKKINEKVKEKYWDNFSEKRIKIKLKKEKEK